MTVTEDFERFYYSAFQTRFFFGKQKTGVLFFSLKYYNLKLNISTQNCSDRSECEDKYNREYKMDLSQRTEFCHYRANICWSSRRHEDVFKTCLEDVFNTSSAYQFFVFQDVFKTSWRHLEDVLEDEKLLRWRHLEDVLKTCLQHALRTCLEDVFKTSWRQTKFYWGYLYLTNLSVNLTNLYFYLGESKMH